MTKKKKVLCTAAVEHVCLNMELPVTLWVAEQPSCWVRGHKGIQLCKIMLIAPPKWFVFNVPLAMYKRIYTNIEFTWRDLTSNKKKLSQ